MDSTARKANKEDAGTRLSEETTEESCPLYEGRGYLRMIRSNGLLITGHIHWSRRTYRDVLYVLSKALEYIDIRGILDRKQFDKYYLKG